MTSNGSVSGLTAKRRLHARQTILRGVSLLMRDPASVHYTQGPQRWQGIDKHLTINADQCITQGDCSSTATWLLWNALFVSYGVRDVVNDEAWRAGYTGTIAQNGKRVVHDYSIKVGDLILYGRGPTYEHVTVAIGGGRCFSHGGEAGPFLLPIDYRADRAQVRRFI